MKKLLNVVLSAVCVACTSSTSCALLPNILSKINNEKIAYSTTSIFIKCRYNVNSHSWQSHKRVAPFDFVPSSQSEPGPTALDIAIKKEWKSVIELLENNGAKTTCELNCKWFLHRPCYSGCCALLDDH